MIYRFRSPAAGDVVMLGPSGDELLRLLGREPAPQGIIEPAAMPAAIEALHAAVTAAESEPATDAPDAAGDDDAAASGGRGVSLRQRVWPFVEMLRRAQAEDKPVTWGV